MFWNRQRAALGAGTFGFNPCEGFGCFGTSSSARWLTGYEVSIPVRDLDVLEPFLRRFLGLPFSVSIPVRDLDVLEQHGLAEISGHKDLFQSL